MAEKVLVQTEEQAVEFVCNQIEEQARQAPVFVLFEENET